VSEQREGDTVEEKRKEGKNMARDEKRPGPWFPHCQY
jgi:hypothetical protein